MDKIPVIHHSIFREGDIYSRDELPVFHVHGFLPRDTNRYDSLGESTLVFSEEGYHEVFSDPYHWSNLVQLSHLREDTCLMIGLSLQDPNLRRLLEIAARKNVGGRHFALMKRMTAESFMNNSEGKPVVKARKTAVRNFLSSHHGINEELFSELGLSIVWFEEFSEIPAILNQIQQE